MRRKVDGMVIVVRLAERTGRHRQVRDRVCRRRYYEMRLLAHLLIERSDKIAFVRTGAVPKRHVLGRGVQYVQVDVHPLPLMRLAITRCCRVSRFLPR